MTSAGVTARRVALRAPSLRADLVLVGVAVAVLAYLTVVPLAMLLLGAVSRGGSILDFRFTTQWLERVLTGETSVELLFNSVLYAAGAAVWGLGLAGRPAGPASGGSCG